MCSKAQPSGQFPGALHQFVPGLDAEDAGFPGLLLEEKIVEDEAQIGLAGAVVHQAEVRPFRRHLLQQRLDELEQVVDLLQLAPAVLVHLPLPGEDVQFLQQLDRLAGADFVHGMTVRMGKGAILNRWGGEFTGWWQR
jgi:hypothetical protein